MNQSATTPKWKKKQQGNNSSTEIKPVYAKYSLNSYVVSAGEFKTEANLRNKFGRKNSSKKIRVQNAYPVRAAVSELFVDKHLSSAMQHLGFLVSSLASKLLVGEYFSLDPSHRADPPKDKELVLEFVGEYFSLAPGHRADPIKDKELVSELFVGEYFSLAPGHRADLLKDTAELIRSSKAVLEILNWSTKGEIRDGYDAGINLLAECENIGEAMLEVARKLLGDYPKYDRDEAFVVDEKLEILIKGIACSEYISPDRKLEMISNFMSQTDRRSVKAAIIDSLLMIEDEAGVEEVRSRLDRFLSDSEPDEYIREYVQDAIE